MATDTDLGSAVHSRNDGTDGHVRVKMVGDPAGAGVTASDHVAVDADKNAHVEGHGNDPSGSDQIMRMSEQGSVSIDGVYDVANNSDPSQIGLVAMVRNDTPVDSHLIQRVTGAVNGAGTIRTVDISLFDEDGEPYTAINPLPVTVATTEASVPLPFPGAQSTKEDLASGITDDHDITVPINTTVRLDQIIADASGDARYDLQLEDAATPATFQRIAITYGSNAKRGDMAFGKGFIIVAGANTRIIRIIRKNLDNKIQDVHTTVLGVTLP